MNIDGLSELTDDLLVAHFRGSAEPRYFAEIFRRHHQRVFRACAAVVRDADTAADLTQETFVRALERLDSYRGGCLLAWLLTLARHCSINHLRSLDRGARRLPGLNRASTEPQRLEHSIDVAARIEELAPPQQLCLKLYYYNGLSYSEIAVLTGLAQSQVRSHMQNGIGRMRRSELRR